MLEKRDGSGQSKCLKVRQVGAQRKSITAASSLAISSPFSAADLSGGRMEEAEKWLGVHGRPRNWSTPPKRQRLAGSRSACCIAMGWLAVWAMMLAVSGDGA